MRCVTDPVLWSNVLFFGNGVLWQLSGHRNAAILIVLCGIASIGYHLYKEANLFTYLLDASLAYATLVYTLYTAYPYMNFEHLQVLGIVLGIGLFVKRKALVTGDYTFYHTLWHFFVFIGQALLAFISRVS